MPFTPYNSSTQTSTTDYSPLQDFLKANNPAYANTNFQGSSSSQPAQAPTQQPGLLESVGKDALSTLLVKPATRIAQAGVAPLQLQKSQSTTDIQNQQTDQLNTVLAKLKTESDPTKKQALSQMAHKLVDQATANTQEGQQANLEGEKLDSNTHIAGQDIQSQQGGTAGVKQIAGDALKSASYLAAPEAASVTGEAANAVTKIATGAGTGAAIGAAGGAGSELENPNSTTGSILQAAGQGAGTGAAIGGAIPAIGEGVKAVNDLQNGITRPSVNDLSKSATNSLENSKLGEKPGAIERAKAEIKAGNTPPVKVRTLENGSQVIEDGRHHLEAAKQLGIKNYPVQDVTEKYKNSSLESKIKDATPDYSKKIATDYIKNSEGKTVPRVNEGEGITGKRTVNTSGSEMENAKELGNIKNYPDKGTALQKSQAIHDAISTEAENMRSGLQAEDKASPLDTKTEKIKLDSLIKSKLPTDIKAKFGYISPQDEAKLSPSGKAFREAQIAAEPPEMPKTAAGRYYQKVLDSVKEYDGTREGKLNLRQSLDNAYKDARGKLAFGSDTQNSLDEIHSDIRDAINKDLKVSTQNTDTQASLDKQTKLYRAKDVLDNKAQAEATSKFERFMQIHPLLHKIGTRGLMRIAIEITGVSLAAATINKILKNAIK